MSLETFSTYWSVVEASLVFGSALLSVYLFFKDPIRRWRFFGYRPTLIMLLFDQAKSEILLTKELYSGKWLLPQGGVADGEVVSTIQETLLREAGLEPYHYAIKNVLPLRTLPLGTYSSLHRENLGGISIVRRLRGKGYIACTLIADMKDVRRVIRERGLEDRVKVQKLTAAKKTLLKSYTDTQNLAKHELVIDALDRA